MLRNIRFSILLGFLSAFSCNNQDNNCFTPNLLSIEIVAENYVWHIRYPGIDNQLFTTDDILTIQNFHLPINTNISIQLTSKDNVHFFSIPELNLIETAAPNLKHFLKFSVSKPSYYDVEATQMCGYTHESLHSKVIIESPCKFQHWLSNQINELVTVK